MGRRWRLSFDEWKMDDESTARIVGLAYSLRELLDISRIGGSEITDEDMYGHMHTKHDQYITLGHVHNHRSQPYSTDHEGCFSTTSVEHTSQGCQIKPPINLSTSSSTVLSLY